MLQVLSVTSFSSGYNLHRFCDALGLVLDALKNKMAAMGVYFTGHRAVCGHFQVTLEQKVLLTQFSN